MHRCATLGRYPYSSITRRNAFRWPNGARLALYFALGVEEYSFGEGLTENLVSAGSHPDVLNSSWRDYGNRVGAWRLLDAFREYRLPLSVLLNSAVCESAPDLVKAAQEQGCELIAHGYSNSDTLQGLNEQQESRVPAARRAPDSRVLRPGARGLVESLDRRDRAHSGPAAGSGLQLCAGLLHG